MGEGVRGGRAGQRAPWKTLAAGVSALCLVLAVAPAAAASPSRTSFLQAAAAVEADLTAGAVTGTTKGATGRTGDPVTVTLLGADSAADPERLTYTAGRPASGSVAIDGDQLTYTPADGFFGDVSFTYSVANEQGDTVDGMVTITVVHDGAPVAGNASVTTRGAIGRPGTPARIQVSISDSDPATLVYAVSDPANGSATIGAPSTPTGPVTIIYTPGSGFSGTEVFTWTATDSHGEVGTGTITVTVTANTAPVASGVSATVKGATNRPGDIARLDLTAVDPDGPDGTLTYELVDRPTAGEGVVGLSGAQLTFTPAAGYSGTVVLRYRATDSVGDSATATATIVVTQNEAPSTPTVSKTTQGSTTFPGTPVTLVLPASDPDGIAGYTVGATTRGFTTQNGSSVTYTPKPGISGVDSFAYTATDGRGRTSTGTVTVNVLPNDRPVGTTTTASTVYGRPVVIPLTATDKQGDAVSFSGSSPADHGSVTYQGAIVTYVPDLQQGRVEDGLATFAYTAKDARGAVSTPTVLTITIHPNAAPVAAPVTVGTRGGSGDVPGRTVTIPLSATDAEQDFPLTFALSGQPDNGTAVMLASGNGISYTPDPGFVGTETISYGITDHVVVGGVERPDLEASGSATAKVVVAANSAPTAPLVQLTTDGSTTGPGAPVLVPLSSTDVDGDGITYSVAAPDAGVGTITPILLGQFTFTPTAGFSGAAVLSYVAADPLGASTSGVIVIDVKANRPPTADSRAVVARGGTTTVGVPLPIPMASAITDPDGDPVSLTNVTALNGTVTMTGTTLVYRSRSRYAGPDTIRYEARDDRGGLVASTVTVTVVANRPPTLRAESRRIEAGQRVVVYLTGSDPNGDALTRYTVTDPRKGSVTLTGNRMLFTSPADYAGPVTVRTTVTDALGASGSSTVAFTVYGRSSFTGVTGPARPVSSVPPTFTAVVSARAGDVSGGTVTVKAGTRVLGSGKVAPNGLVTIRSTVKVAKGTYTLTFLFGGTATTGPASTLRGLTVVS